MHSYDVIPVLISPAYEHYCVAVSVEGYENMTDFSAVPTEIYRLIIFDSPSNTHGEIY